MMNLGHLILFSCTFHKYGILFMRFTTANVLFFQTKFSKTHYFYLFHLSAKLANAGFSKKVLELI